VAAFSVAVQGLTFEPLTRMLSRRGGKGQVSGSDARSASNR
jgi:hypothetical protein